MAVWVCLDGDADVEAGRVGGAVGAEVVWVHGVGDVGGDEEAVGVGLSEEVGAGVGSGAAGGRGGEGFEDSRDGAGEEVAAGALAEERADFFVVEEAGDFDDAAGGVATLGGG